MRNLIKLITSAIISLLGIQGATVYNSAGESLSTANSCVSENMDSNNNKTLLQENEGYHPMAIFIFWGITIFAFLYSFYHSVASRFKKF